MYADLTFYIYAFLDLCNVLLLQYGHTPVKIAAESGKCEAVRLLLNKTANITIADKVSTNNIVFISLLLHLLLHFRSTPCTRSWIFSIHGLYEIHVSY